MRLAVMTLLMSFAVSLSPVAVAAENAAPQAKQVLTFTNKLVDGKKTWLPTDASIHSGDVEITLVNTLAEPHGFTVPGLVDNVVVDANATKKVTATAKAPGKLAFSCQLHPAHVGGHITVQ